MNQYEPVSDWAKENFSKYQTHGLKVAKETGSQILFVNPGCIISDDGQLDVDTFKYGFWAYKHDDVREKE